MKMSQIRHVCCSTIVPWHDLRMRLVSLGDVKGICKLHLTFAAQASGHGNVFIYKHTCAQAGLDLLFLMCLTKLLEINTVGLSVYQLGHSLEQRGSQHALPSPSILALPSHSLFRSDNL